MSNTTYGWSRRLLHLALLAILAAMPTAVMAEWKQVEEWPAQEFKLEPGTEGVEYNPALNRYVGLEKISTKMGELIQVVVGSYDFQPTVTVLDANNEPQSRGRHRDPVPSADGYTWYETELQFECCPGANSGDDDIPSNYVLRYSSQGVVEVGVVVVSGARLVWVVPDVVDPGPFECNCQDPDSGKWYEGSLGGLSCPPVTPETRFCKEP